MNNYKKIEKFNEIYNQTYQSTIKYIMLHCNNLEDMSDLVQDTYLELYKNISKNKLKNIQYNKNYMIGIAKNIIKKYYKTKQKNCKMILWENEDKEIENFTDKDINIELDFITKENVGEIWKYIENKGIKIEKVFYCYYHLDMKIADIAKEMNLNESTVKSYIYRTIRELQKNFGKESDINV